MPVAQRSFPDINLSAIDFHLFVRFLVHISDSVLQVCLGMAFLGHQTYRVTLNLSYRFTASVGVLRIVSLDGQYDDLRTRISFFNEIK